MPDLARGVGRAAEHSATAHDRAAEPGRHGDVDEVPRAARRADRALRDGGHRRVAVDEDREAVERFGQPRSQRELFEPDDVRRLVHQAGAMVERPRRGAADRLHRMEGEARLARGRMRGIRDGANDGVGAVAGRAALIARGYLVVVAVERRDDRADVRAAEIDAEKAVVAQTLGSLPASSGVDSALASPSSTVF